MAGVWIDLQAIVLRGLEASAGKLSGAFPVSCGLRGVWRDLRASVYGRCPSWTPSIGSSRPGGEHGQVDRSVSGELWPSKSMRRSGG